MAQTFMVGVLALLIGFGAGSYGGEVRDQTQQRLHDQQQDQAGTAEREQVQNRNQEHMMISADDFVSLRPAVMNTDFEDLSAAERDGLLFMREEEKLARDVYTTLYETWGIQIFRNIAQSEQTHTEAVRVLIEKYGLDDPVQDDSIGVFTNVDLQALYDELVGRGQTSETEALKVGVLIEELDIKDIQEQIDLTDNADITLVYENLLRGSRNHLRAFMKQLSMRGEDYEPQHISQEQFDDIVGGSMEGGMGSSQRGWGGGSMQGGQGGGRRN